MSGVLKTSCHIKTKTKGRMIKITNVEARISERNSNLKDSKLKKNKKNNES